MRPDHEQPAPPQRPVLTVEALVVLLIAGLAATAAIIWPNAAIAIGTAVVVITALVALLR